MSTVSPEQLREALRTLGERKATIEHDDEELTREIKETVALANGSLSMTEVADLLGIHRTTLYRVYRP